MLMQHIDADALWSGAGSLGQTSLECIHPFVSNSDPINGAQHDRCTCSPDDNPLRTQPHIPGPYLRVIRQKIPVDRWCHVHVKSRNTESGLILLGKTRGHHKNSNKEE